MKNVSKVRLSLRKLLIAAMAVGPLAVLPAPVWAALPTSSSFTATNGTVTVTNVTASVVNINATDRSVLVWGSGNFNIGALETWNFNLPTGGAILNKVGYTTIGTLGATDTAVIDGTLLSTGRVFILANGNISVGAGAVINTTGGLVLSTLQDSEAAFVTTGNLLGSGNATGNITLSNALNVTGDLEAYTGQFGGGSIGGGNVVGNFVLRSVTANAGVELGNGGLALGVRGGNLTVITNNGAITQNGAITANFNADSSANAGRITTLSTGSTGTSGITLSNASNNFGTVALTSNGVVTLRDTNAVVLAASNVGNLAVTSSGNISTSGTLAVRGDAAFDAGTGTVTIANNSTIGGVLSGNRSGNGNFSVSVTGNLQAGDITSAGGGNIVLTSTGVNRITGNLNFVAGGNATITGSSITQNATGVVTSANVTTFNGTSGGVTLGNITTNRIAVTSANATINQTSGTGVTTLGTATSLSNSFNAGSGAVTLNSTTNNLAAGPALNITAGSANIVTGNTTGVNLGTANITGGNLTLNATGGNIALGGVLVGASAGRINVTGTLNLLTSGAGEITDNNYSAINVLGGINIAAGSGNIVLDAATQNAGLAPLVTFGRFDASTTGSITVQETTTLNLGDVSAFSLSARSLNGDIIQSGDLAIDSGLGTASFQVSAAGNVTLLGESNDIGVVNFIGGSNVNYLSNASSVEVGSGTAIAGNLTVTSTEGNDITIAAPTVTGSLSINSGDEIVVTSATAVTGNVTLVAAGDITQSATLRSTGATSISAGGDVILNLANDFGAVTLAKVDGDATIVDINSLTVSGNVAGVLTARAGVDTGVVSTYGLTLGDLVVGGIVASAANGSATAADGPSGAITQVAGTRIGSVGDSSFTTNNATITLSNAGNSFGGVTLVAGNGTVTLTEASTLRLANLTTTGNATLTSTFGSIIESGATAIGGNVLTLNAPAGSVLLNSSTGTATSNTVVISAPTGAAAVRSSQGNLALGNVTALSLTVNHTGTNNLTQSGRANVFGSSNFTSGGNIILSNTTNNFGRVALTSSTANKNVTVTEAATLNLGLVSMAGTTGNFTATSVNGDIIDSGLLGVVIDEKQVNLTAAGNIILDDPTTSLNATEGVRFAGNNVTFATINPIVLGINNTTSTATTLTVTSATGSITDAGNLTVTGDATFQTGNQAIVLDSANNRFGSIRFSGSTVTVNQVNDINIITGSTATQNAQFTSGSYIAIDNRGGSVTIGGTATFLAAGSIVLPKLIQVANTLTVSSPNTKNLGALSISADLGGKEPVNLGTGTYVPPTP